MKELRLRRLGVALVGAALVLVAACGGSSDDGGGLETPGESLAGEIAAPEFPTGHTWFNVGEPLTIAGLRGKMVVLDFWTLGCINCQHIVPDLKQLEEEFGDELVVIGVHSGKYDREHDDESIREAILRLELEHPVVNDPDFAIWNTYQANAWPTTTVIDPAGNVVGAHSGEGVYEVLQPVLTQLQAEFAGQIDSTPIPLDRLAEPISTAFLSFPGALLVDEAGGRLFIADSGNNRILVSDLDGKLQSAIGSGRQGFEDGFAEEAQFSQPHGLELSADGQTLYVADTRNHALRTVDVATGEVETIAGVGTRAFEYPSEGAAATATALASPWGLELIGNTLYIGMAGTHQIWAMDIEAGTLSVFVGSGRENKDDGPRLQATLAQPSGLTTDGESLFWVDPESSSVRKVGFESGEVETLVGKGLFDFGDVDGAADVALMEHPQGLVFVDGALYVADTYNHKVKTVDPESGEAQTFAGTGESGHANGDAESAQFAEPGSIAFGVGKLWVADTNNHAIRTIDPGTGEVATLELTNLGVAVSGGQGRTLKVSLPAQEVSSAADSIIIKLRAPEGYHLNDLIASRLAFSTSDGSVFAATEAEVSFQVSDQLIELMVPASVGEGQAILSAQGEIYYCREGQEAICLIDEVDLALPLTVAAGAVANSAAIEYELPQ